MPVVINGSTGISGTDGSAATPAIQGTDTNTGIFFPSADTIAFSEGGVEGMRLDSSGNVSTTGALTVGGAAAVTGALTVGGTAVVAVSPTTAGNVIFTTNGTTWSSTAKIVSGTSVASTSGTSIDFTGIPSWAKRVTVMFAGVSTSGTSAILFQLGTSSGPTTSGYVAGGVRFGTSAVAGTSYSAGFGVNIAAAADTYSGSIIITNVNSNTWSAQGSFGCNTSSIAFTSAGQVALAATLDRVRITTVGGTDTFDAGTINIMYE